MSALHHIAAVFRKQVKDSFKNRLILVVFFMFPVLAMVFKEIVSKEELDFMLPSFMTMNTVMIPIIFMSSIIAEEKEKKTLRMLIMSNVRSWEYLLGVVICVFLQALLSTCVFLAIIPNSMEEAMDFIVVSTIGIICSLLIGAILAIIAKNQMSVGPVTAPVSMLIGLLPMFSAMNDKLEHAAKALYSYYVRESFVSHSLEIDESSWAVIGLNFVVLLFLFIILYKYKGLGNE